MAMPVLAIGPAVFEILPLSLQRITEMTRANWASVPRFGRAAARQLVGFGDDSFRIEGLFFNSDFGGFEDYMLLKRLQAAGEPLDLLGGAGADAYATVFGPVVILQVGATHEYIGEGGVGRKVEFDVELAPSGDGAYGGGLF